MKVSTVPQKQPAIRSSAPICRLPKSSFRSTICQKPSVSRRSGRASLQRMSAATVGIEKEEMLSSTPDSLLRERSAESEGIRGRFERIIRDAQTKICAAVEEEDGEGKFREDAWARPGGGGGVSRVMQGGKVWEKAGVGVSVVYGTMPPEAYRAAKGHTGTANGASNGAAGGVPFFAAGISSVMHPHNPFAPTMHFNYRYFETEEWNGIPGQWWFGGGTDITPSYINEEDLRHFHGTYKRVCDNHDPSYYPKFKKWADDYFLCKHRNQRRGLGGIFFDDLNDRPQDEILAFSTEALGAVTESYLPLVNKHKNDPFTEKNKEWQQMRRGLYVEYNLVYDRGTTFGLKTAGRIESILMSLPLTARWEYCPPIDPTSPEAELVEACTNPREWA
ncbi:g10880 [Coccomyxa elongata]